MIPEWLQTIINETDWVNVGTQILGYISLILGFIVWFKKNFGDVNKLKTDMGDLGGFTAYFISLLKSDKNLLREFSDLKREVYNFKHDLRIIIQEELKAVKEDRDDGLHK